MIPALPLAALGGALGAMLRHLMDLAWPHERTGALPWDLFAANLAGCLAAGCLAGRTRHAWLQAFLLQGVLGGLTSFAGVIWILWQVPNRSLWPGALMVVVSGFVAGVTGAAVVMRRFGPDP